jgi:putative hydrolase of the HAD superfamily
MGKSGSVPEETPHAAEEPNVAPAGLIVKVIAVACYLFALAGAVAFAVLVVLLGCAALPPRPTLSWPLSLVLDLAWLFAFGLQHSGMARESFKRRARGLVPPCLERSLYAGLSGLLVLLLALTWQPLPGPVLWRAPLWVLALPLSAVGGLALINARYDHAGLFGLRQAWAGNLPTPPERLLITGPYRLVRHPLMACLLVFLWAQPVMAPTLAILAGGLTVYVAIALVLEERDLLRTFGPRYAAYRRLVPALVPWRWPAPAAVWAPCTTVRAIFFDAVGTLIHPEPAAGVAYHAVGQRHGCRLDLPTVRARFAAAFRRQEEQDAASGLRTDDAREVARWRAIVAEVLEVTDPEACFQELYEHFADPASWRVSSEAAPVLRALAERGYRLGIASNFDGRLRGVVAALPALAAVQHLVISSEVGWRKPSPHFFAALCRQVGLRADEVLLVGDDLANDHAGASAAGLRALLLAENGEAAVPAQERIARLAELPALLPGPR